MLGQPVDFQPRLMSIQNAFQIEIPTPSNLNVLTCSMPFYSPASEQYIESPDGELPFSVTVSHID